MEVLNAGKSPLYTSDDEFAAIMIACGFTEDSLKDMRVLAAYDSKSGVTEVIVWADCVCFAGNNSDGWNKINSLQEIGDLDAADIDAIFGDGASQSDLWAAYLAQK